MGTVYQIEKKISIRKQATNSLRKIKNFIVFLLYKFRASTFVFRSETYRYFFHYYNATWKNERTVEVPIIKQLLEKEKGKRILEVGNVLQYYIPVTHDVLDKYETRDGVMSLDIVDFVPKEKYNFIVSVSTLEHVGWDEIPKEPKKLDLAIKNLKENCLAMGGTMVVTLPLGYNSYVDELLSRPSSDLGELFFLKRIGNSVWKEVRYEEVRGSKYDSPFSSSNAICISILKKES